MEQIRKLAAIMFTDIEGYTAVMQRSEEEALSIRNRHREIFETTTKLFKGQILQYYGDGTLSIFDSAVEAVYCAYELQKEFFKGSGIPVRIGIHTGDILFSKEDIIGDGVNIASRIESLGTAGSVLFSKKVYDEIKNQKGIKVKPLGSFHFKNVSEKIVVYALANEGLVVPKTANSEGKLASLVSGEEKSPANFLARFYLKYKNRSKTWSLALISFMLIGVIGFWQLDRYLSLKRNEVKLEETLFRIDSLSEDLSFAGAQSGEGINAWIAFTLAKKVEKTYPNEDLLDDLWPLFSRPINIYSTPERAEVYAKAYEDDDSDGYYLGKTPLDSVRFPYGYSNLTIRREGSEIMEDVIWNTHLFSNTFNYRLPDSGSLPSGMVLVNYNPTDQNNTGQYDFYMDRCEVTNQAYQSFVDSGGYNREEFWEQPFIKEGRELSWKEAMLKFTDRIGRTGPATWTSGTFPEGQVDHPVGGLSWYEAMAYAKFAGKSLLTSRHWSYVVADELSSVIIPKSNYQGTGSMPVGSLTSMNRFGVQDMAGNVREWIVNASAKTGTRLIKGGGWNDSVLRVGAEMVLDAWDRDHSNGFRCVQYQEYSPDIRKLEEFILQESRPKHLEMKPVTAEVFQVYLNQFDYDRTDLEAAVESRVEEQYWIKEKILFRTGYGSERMTGYLFLPKRGRPPFQTILYFPAWNAYNELSLQTRQIDFLIKDGRAVMYPVYQDMHERMTKGDNRWQKHRQKEIRIMQVKDLRRSIDYLQTRTDIDTDNLAYMGISLGGQIGPLALAAENRLKAGILVIAGLSPEEALPEIDELFYLPHVKQPVLMFNGENDFHFPYETSQKPFFELLGTPIEHKVMLRYPGSHHVPKKLLIRESLVWLDLYQGQVELFKN